MDQEVWWLLAEKLLHVRTGPLTPNDDVISRRSRALATFGSTLEALRYVNAISEDESIQWRNKMWQAIGLEPPEVAEPGTIRLVYLGEGEPPQLERNLIPRYPRKVSGPSETIGACSGCLRAQEVEYDDSVTLIRWQIGPLPDVDAAFPQLAAALKEDVSGMDGWAVEHFKSMNREALRRHRVPRLELEDNVGTKYSEHPVGSGGAAEIKGTTAFTPGTPSHAEHITLHWLGSSLTIDL